MTDIIWWNQKIYSDTHNMDKSNKKLSNTWRTQEYILYNFIYGNFKNSENLTEVMEVKIRMSCRWGWGTGRETMVLEAAWKERGLLKYWLRSLFIWVNVPWPCSLYKMKFMWSFFIHLYWLYLIFLFKTSQVEETGVAPMELWWSYTC